MHPLHDPPEPPEGEVEVDLCLPELEDQMSNDELAHLDEALTRGFAAIEAGRFRPAADVIADLRCRATGSAPASARG